MLIAEEVLILLTDTEGRAVSTPRATRTVCTGALLLELELAGRLRLDDAGRLMVTDGAPTGAESPGGTPAEPLPESLEEAMALFAKHEGRKPKTIMPVVARRCEALAYDALLASGAAEEEKHNALGFIPDTRRHLTDPAGRDALHREVQAVLLGEQPPTTRTGSLIALLHAASSIHTVFAGAGGLSDKELRGRAADIADGEWASEASRGAIRSMQTAMVVGVGVAMFGAGS